MDVDGQQVIGVPGPGLSLAAGDMVEASIDLNAAHVIDRSGEGGDV